MLFKTLLILGAMLGGFGTLGAQSCPDAPDPCTVPGCLSPAANRFGLYTDKPSYSMSDSIVVFGDWGVDQPVYELLRLNGTSYLEGGAPEFDPPIASSGSIPSAFSTSLPGSFVDFKNPSAPGGGLTLAARTQFTLEGWFCPTFLYGASEDDDIVIAGQLAMSGGKVVAGNSSAGIALRGKDLFWVLRTSSGTVAVSTPVNIGGAQPALGKWHHVAMAYYGIGAAGGVRVYYNGQPLQTVLITGQISAPAVSEYLRIGASLQAPGDRTGCFTGRVDSWSLYGIALTKNQILARFQEANSPPCSGCPTVAPVMKADFEESFTPGYAVGDFTQGGASYTGAIIGHGAPGVTGWAKKLDGSRGNALALRHDQVVDAGFSQVAYFSGLGEPGLYAVHAKFPAAPEPDIDASHYQCIVVRPSVKHKIAVILPVMTWMVYNPWPGFMGLELSHFTANGIAPRYGTDGKEISQGNNSLYNVAGDGRTQSYYTSWMRPNLRASPVRNHAGSPLIEYLTNPANAAENYNLIRWLNKVRDITMMEDEDYQYDVYTDLDLHFGLVPVSGMAMPKVMVITGHPEYWSETVLSKTKQYMDNGGNLLVAAGNALAWRVEPRLRSGVSRALGAGLPELGNWIVEARRWPFIDGGRDGETDPMLMAEYDRIGWFGSGQAGSWRFIEHLKTTDTKRDMILGTANDITGGFCKADSSYLDSSSSGQFGHWKATTGSGPVPPTSWWPAVDDQEFPPRVVGQEVDSFFAGDYPYFKPPYMTNELELAEGIEFTQCTAPVDCRMKVHEPGHCVYDYANNTPRLVYEVSQLMCPLSLQYASNDGSHGSVVYYEYGPGGGWVLNIGTMFASATLHKVSAVEDLATAALRCAVENIGCPP